MTFALITLNPLAIVNQWVQLPSSIDVPGIGQVAGATGGGWTKGNYALANVTTVGSPIDQFSVLQSTTLAFDGITLTVTNTYAQRAPTKAELLSYAHAKRFTKMQSGTTLGGNAIPTDLQTQVILLAAYVQAVANASFTMQWSVSGVPVTLTATNIKAAMAQVGIFFGSIQQMEATAITGINGGTITTVAQVDAVFV